MRSTVTLLSFCFVCCINNVFIKWDKKPKASFFHSFLSRQINKKGYVCLQTCLWTYVKLLNPKRTWTSWIFLTVEMLYFLLYTHKKKSTTQYQNNIIVYIINRYYDRLEQGYETVINLLDRTKPLISYT